MLTRSAISFKSQQVTLKVSKVHPRSVRLERSVKCQQGQQCEQGQSFQGQQGQSNNSNVNPRYAMSVQCQQGHKSQSKIARLVQGQEACSLFPVVSNTLMKELLIKKYLAEIMNVTSLQ